ncbi:Pvc16 family protein [Nonomuraea sp. NPDC047897]|uniref:Pvc16 family protein n=1 Tax=Nonomuraea sp. NPDC047897 TaxID=3364346 RepID=UPI00371CCF27
MINEADDLLCGLIREAAGDPGVEIVLTAPTPEWAASLGGPAVSVYLYDIREDLRRRQHGVLNEYAPSGAVSARHLPPRYVRLSYHLTVWADEPEVEHGLLSALLGTLLACESPPADRLTGSLADLRLPVTLGVAAPGPDDGTLRATLGGSFGGVLRPALDVVVTAPLMAAPAIPAAPPVTEPLSLHSGRHGDAGAAATERRTR